MLARLRLIPQDDYFFELFQRSAANNLHGAQLLNDLLMNFADVGRRARHLKDVEHTGDEITHELFRALNRTFVTPLDREDISALASSLDDVIDWIEEVTRRINLYHVEVPTPVARQFGQVILKQCEQIAQGMPLLEHKSQYDALHASMHEVHRLENEADDMLADAIATMYDGVAEVPELISAMRWEDLYRLFEDTTDKAEHVATVLSTIALKKA